MANWYYYNESGEKIEVTGGQLKELAKTGMITPETIVETEDGKKARAGKVKGLTFAKSETEETVIAPPPQVVTPPTANVYCTNCGNPIAENAVACMSCGAKPTGHKKFCRHCGVALNPEQVICIKCGAGIEQAAFVQPAQAIMPSVASLSLANHPTLGKVLASGNGKGNPGIGEIWLVCLVSSVIMAAAVIGLSYVVKNYSDEFVRSATVASKEGEHDKARKEADIADRYTGYSNAIFVAGLIIPVIAIVLAGVVSNVIARSEIIVYENGLTGTGFLRSSVFQLTYDSITNVKVQNANITIHASGASYRCYTKSQLVAEEIQSVIVEQQQKVANQTGS